MSFDSFTASLDDRDPPALSSHGEALWWALRGEWERAHEIVQDLPDRDAAWIHACLHREEGDLGNARYWYHQAGRPEASGSTREELLSIAKELLGRD